MAEEAVIDEVESACRERTIYMIGPEKARRLAELVREKRPELVVECGTAIGYSGLWIARELRRLGRGRLVTIEVDPARAREARSNFERAGLAEIVDVITGDAREAVREIEGPVDFLFLDCDYANYLPSFTAIEPELADGAVIAADNAGIGAAGMKEYLVLVRSRYESRTEWFDLDLPWARRDAMEVSILRRP